MKNITIAPGNLSLADCRDLLNEEITIQLDQIAYDNIERSQQVVDHVIARNETVYSINTGFGSLATTHIATEELAALQKNIVLSHAAGTGPLLSNDIVRLILLLKINSLACGHSGVRPKLIDALIRMFNTQMYPCIPAKGSVGASGDLAPLAHMSLPLLGVGQVSYQGEKTAAINALAKIDLLPFDLAPKEGLALLNGTQVSTALAMSAYFSIEHVFSAAVFAGALTVDAGKGSDTPFMDCLHQVRRQQGQITVAKFYRDLLEGSEIRESHRHCQRVQDPYSLRCQPQVMGACYDFMQFAAQIIQREANAVSDNPLVFAAEDKIISGGNFHAEPIAMAADNLAMCIAEIASLSERRIAFLIDAKMSGLPAFLVNNAGVNSGFMLAHVTAAALVSENKTLAHPACVDSLPTSANQEDHVSMATFAARRLHDMADNAATVVAIELLAACQAIEFHRPLKTSVALEHVLSLVREHVPNYDKDRYFSPDIEAVKALVLAGAFVL